MRILLVLLVAAAAVVPAKPAVVSKPIPFGVQRRAETAQYAAKSYQCYPKAVENDAAVWSAILKNSYIGTGGFTSTTDCHTEQAVNYDNHPGYDFAIQALRQPDDAISAAY